MKLLSRLLLLVFCAGLIVPVWVMVFHTRETTYLHDTYYIFKWPWLQDVRQISLFGILGWCVIFARSETTFVRLGLITIIFAFATMAMPVRHGSVKVLNAEQTRVLRTIH